MGLLHDRTENDTEVVVVFKHRATISLVTFGLLLLAFQTNSILWSSLLVLAVVIFGVTVSVMMWSMTREVRAAMRQGGVQVSGSRWSWANPITYKIPKRPTPSAT
jgi:predicted lysophospholipase L1 biosynthesis ABC-type transport system permease subunit